MCNRQADSGRIYNHEAEKIIEGMKRLWNMKGSTGVF